MLLSLWFCLALVVPGLAVETTTSFTDDTTASTTETTPTSTMSTKQMNCNFVLAGSHGELQSPNYPSKYPNNLNCTWRILKPEQPSMLRFKHFALEGGAGCRFDNLSIQVGLGKYAVKLGPFCGNNLPASFEFIDEVLVNFVTDKNSRLTGFRAIYEPGCETPNETEKPQTPTTTTPSTNTPQCQFRLHEPSGEFYSPNYPNIYPTHVNCKWTIERPEHCSTLTFYELSIENCYLCACDNLTVNAGSAGVYGPYCNGIRPGSIEFTDTITVTFLTDGNRNGYGFRATYAPGCGQETNSNTIQRGPVPASVPGSAVSTIHSLSITASIAPLTYFLTMHY